MDYIFLKNHSRISPALLLSLFFAGCYLSPSINVSKLFIILIAVMFLLVINLQDVIHLLQQNSVLVLFLSFTVLSIFWGEGEGLYPLKSAALTLCFVLFIIYYKECINKNINAILYSIYISAGILSITLLAMHFSRYGFNFGTRIDKLYGPIIQTIKTASILSLGLLIMVWIIVFKSGYQRGIAAMFLIPTLMAILLLKSRGATLSVGAGLAVLFFAKTLNSKKILFSIGGSLMLFLILVVGGLWFFQNYDDRVLSDSFRFVIWRSSIYQVFEENIVAGIGYVKDQDILALDGQVYDHSHNLFVSLLRITGVVGLILFCAYIFQAGRFFFSKYSNTNEQVLLVAWLAMTFTTLFFDCKYPVYFKPDIFILLWAPVALLWVI